MLHCNYRFSPHISDNDYLKRKARSIGIGVLSLGVLRVPWYPNILAGSPISDVGSCLKLGGQVVMWVGHNLLPLVGIGLTDLPNPGWAIAGNSQN